MIRDSVPHIKDIMLPGLWTDDTSMTLCLIESFNRCNGFNATDILDTFVKWFTVGHLSSIDKCFGIGNCTIYALQQYIKEGKHIAPTNEERWCGNGSLMRCSAIPLFFWKDIKITEEIGQISSVLTHSHPICIEACGIWSVAIALALHLNTKQEIIASLPEKYRN